MHVCIYYLGIVLNRTYFHPYSVGTTTVGTIQIPLQITIDDDLVGAIYRRSFMLHYVALVTYTKGCLFTYLGYASLLILLKYSNDKTNNYENYMIKLTWIKELIDEINVKFL